MVLLLTLSLLTNRCIVDSTSLMGSWNAFLQRSHTYTAPVHVAGGASAGTCIDRDLRGVNSNFKCLSISHSFVALLCLLRCALRENACCV